MKIGDYVRTKNGIAKINYISNKPAIYLDNDKVIDEDYRDYHTNNGLPIDGSIYNDTIIKSSPNIIDLIEPGDYVNGLPVANIEGTRYDKNDLCCWLSVGIENEDSIYLQYGCIKAKDIKSVVTHEQFKEMEYKI